MSSSDPEASAGPLQPLVAHYTKAQRQYQQWLDRVTPFVLYRWLSTAGLLALFMLRIVLAQGVSVCPARGWQCLIDSVIALLGNGGIRSGILVRLFPVSTWKCVADTGCCSVLYVSRKSYPPQPSRLTSLPRRPRDLPPQPLPCLPPTPLRPLPPRRPPRGRD